MTDTRWAWDLFRESVEAERAASDYRGRRHSNLRLYRAAANVFNPALKFFQRQLALQTMALVAVPNFAIERRKKIKCYVSRLKSPGVGLRNVIHQRSERARPRG